MDDNRTGPFVIGFNGPPRVGKDTIATALLELLDREGVTNLPIHRQALAAPLRNACAALLGWSLTDKQYTEVKDKLIPELGVTFRQFMIDMSETFLKPKYQKDALSRLLHARNAIWWDKIPSIMVITDIGFREEAEYFSTHSSLYLNVVLDRPGDYDFTGDSRGYVWSNNYGGLDFVLTNDGTPDDAAQEIARIMYKHGVPVF
jgi:hypothetical protein